TKELRLIDRSAPDSEAKKMPGLDEMTTMLKMIGLDLDSFIMAHELTHALQDELVGLKNLPLEVEDDDDVALASKAVVEGDATVSMMAWLMTRMGRSTNLLFDPMISNQFENLGNMAMPGADAVAHAPEIMKQALIFPYAAGFKFCIAVSMKDRNFVQVDHA